MDNLKEKEPVISKIVHEEIEKEDLQEKIKEKKEEIKKIKEKLKKAEEELKDLIFSKPAT